MKKKKIYKVNHPTITEISKGDIFYTYCGDRVIFVKYIKELHPFPFIFKWVEGYYNRYTRLYFKCSKRLTSFSDDKLLELSEHIYCKYDENKPLSYQTDHPTIKEITIGDQFLTNGGQVITFSRYEKHDYESYIFRIGDGWYDKRLIYFGELSMIRTVRKKQIKSRFYSLKDKIDLL